MREYEIDEDLSRQTARERPMMVSSSLIMRKSWWVADRFGQMAMRWRDDGEQLAVGLHNKMVMTLWVGDRTGD